MGADCSFVVEPAPNPLEPGPGVESGRSSLNFEDVTGGHPLSGGSLPVFVSHNSCEALDCLPELSSSEVAASSPGDSGCGPLSGGTGSPGAGSDVSSRSWGSSPATGVDGGSPPDDGASHWEVAPGSVAGSDGRGKPRPGKPDVGAGRRGVGDDLPPSWPTSGSDSWLGPGDRDGWPPESPVLILDLAPWARF